jgi:hypothetical protein
LRFSHFSFRYLGLRTRQLRRFAVFLASLVIRAKGAERGVSAAGTMMSEVPDNQQLPGRKPALPAVKNIDIKGPAVARITRLQYRVHARLDGS